MNLESMTKTQLIQKINEFRTKYESRYTVAVYIDVDALDDDDANGQVSELLNKALPDLHWSF